MRNEYINKAIQAQELTNWEEAYLWIRANCGDVQNPLEIKDYCKHYFNK